MCWPCLEAILATIQEVLQQNESDAERSATAPRTRQSLPAKGSCWYCDKPLDSVRKFCGKECADAFDEEQAYNAIASPPA
jgi:hypothetical protein